MNFNDFKANWIGKRVADPLLASVGLPPSQFYQCVSLIKQYMREDYQLNVDWPGNAIQFWSATKPDILTKFFRVESSEAQQGDIVVLKTRGHEDYEGDGHIGIATGNLDATNVEILEQNGATGGGSGLGADAIRTRYVPRSRVAGLLRPYVAAIPVQPVEVHPYTIEPITPKEVVINKNTHRWGMTYDNFTAIAANPISEIAAGQHVVVSAICHHNIGYSYYLPDANEPSGYNTLDCDDVPEPVPAVPYVPPTGAMPVPTDTTPYELVVEVPGYTNSNAAINHVNTPAPVLLPVGTDYMVFSQRFNDNGEKVALNITKKQGVPGAWINPLDNTIPPTAPPPASGWTPPRGEDPAVPVVVVPPTPVLNTNAWKTTFKRERVEGKQNLYRFTRDIVVFDKDEKRPKKQMYADEPVDIWGWFEKDGTTYGRPYTGDNLYWYGVPHQFLIREDDFLDLWNYKEQANRKNLSLQRQLDLAIEQAKRKFPKFFDIIRLK